MSLYEYVMKDGTLCTAYRPSWEDDDYFGYGSKTRTGKPVEMVGRHLGPRTKSSHPYSYDPLLQWKKFDTTPRDAHAVYSDRMLQWDYTKFRSLCKKYFANAQDPGGDYFNRRTPQAIEAFMREYFDLPRLELVRVEEQCNVGNGFPLWVFWYRAHKEAAPAATSATRDASKPRRAFPSTYPRHLVRKFKTCKRRAKATRARPAVRQH